MFRLRVYLFIYFGILCAVTSFVWQHACRCLFLCLLLMEPTALWMLDVRQVLCFKLYLFPFPYLFIVYSACECMCVFFCVLCMLRWRLGFDFESPTGIHLSLGIQTPIAGVTSVCHYTQLFMWVWNISTQVLTLAQQAAYSLRHLLSPSFIFQLWFCNKSARRFGWGCLCLIGMLTGSSVLAKVIVCSQKDSLPTWATEHINV